MTPENDSAIPSATDDLAARLYPDLAAQRGAAFPAMTPEKAREVVGGTSETKPANPTAPAATNDDVGPRPGIGDQVSVEDLIGKEQTMAERFYESGGPVPEAPEGYESKLGDTFENLEYHARLERNEEDSAALADGRRESAAVLHEMGVPLDVAGEISRTLGDWHRREPLDEGSLVDAKGNAIAQLEREWGTEAAARIELAQRTARDACKRLPWLADLLAAGAGNDPALIKRFAEIGLRNARRSKR